MPVGFAVAGIPLQRCSTLAVAAAEHKDCFEILGRRTIETADRTSCSFVCAALGCGELSAQLRVLALCRGRNAELIYSFLSVCHIQQWCRTVLLVHVRFEFGHRLTGLPPGVLLVAVRCVRSHGTAISDSPDVQVGLLRSKSVQATDHHDCPLVVLACGAKSPAGSRQHI